MSDDLTPMQSALTALEIGTPPPARHLTLVDGQDAVIDGTAGAPVAPLIVVPETDDSVMRDLAEALENEAHKRTIANAAKNDLQAAVKRTKAAAEHVGTYYNNTRQLGLTLTTGGTSPEDAAESEDD